MERRARLNCVLRLYAAAPGKRSLMRYNARNLTGCSLVPTLVRGRSLLGHDALDNMLPNEKYTYIYSAQILLAHFF